MFEIDKQKFGAFVAQLRKGKGFTQKELAQRLFISDKAVSKWETGKNYPDIHSLVLLSSLFGISLDILVKGDLKEMKEQFDKLEVKKFHRESIIFTALFILMLLSPVPLIMFFKNMSGKILWLAIALITLYDALRIEKYKKSYDIQTYQEITAFMEGKRLDEIEKIKEKAKRPYQKVLLALGSAVLGVLVTIIMFTLFQLF